MFNYHPHVVHEPNNTEEDIHLHTVQIHRSIRGRKYILSCVWHSWAYARSVEFHIEGVEQNRLPTTAEIALIREDKEGYAFIELYGDGVTGYVPVARILVAQAIFLNDKLSLREIKDQLTLLLSGKPHGS